MADDPLKPDVYQAAAPHDALVCVVIAVVAGGVILFPALALLFGLTLGGRFRAAERAAAGNQAARPTTVSFVALARVAVACLIAGFGLLNIADATWAHALGVACLIAFVVVGFGAIIVPGLDGQADALHVRALPAAVDRRGSE